MNIITEDQAAARDLRLPRGGLLTDVDDSFVAELQTSGTFVEYNQQIIAPAGAPLDFVICVVAGEALVSRDDENYRKSRVGTLAEGQWFGELSLFVFAPTNEELSARGEVVVWRIGAETLRDLFFRRPEAVQLLYNFGVLVAQKFVLKSADNVAVSVAAT